MIALFQRLKSRHKDEDVTVMSESTNLEVATLGGGCFWCLEAVFDEVRGVEDVVSGYAGGFVVNPTYRQVCDGKTGHAEVVQVTFDPAVITFREILEIFFAIHDPTTLNRQGADVGPQYRSAIFYHSPEQKATAQAVIAELNGARVFDKPIVTEVTGATRFYPAEDYHQEYFRKNPYQPYCQVVVSPKVAKLRDTTADEEQRMKNSEWGKSVALPPFGFHRCGRSLTKPRPALSL
jgi:peptide-methionine (S)-S-oxide reductase